MMVLAGLDNDAITIDGAGNKIIDGGAGTDSIAINLSGHTTLTDFSVSYASTFTFMTNQAIRLILKI